MRWFTEKIHKLKKRIAWSFFIVYSLIMIWQVFIGPYRSSGSRRYNLIPLKTITNLFMDYRHYTLEILFINLFGNIITFIPLGFFLPWLFGRINTYKKVLITSATVVLAIEVLQFVLNVGVFDIDDLILNIMGSLMGYIGYLFIKRKM